MLTWLFCISVYDDDDDDDNFFMCYFLDMLPFHCFPVTDGLFVLLPLYTAVPSSLKCLLWYPFVLVKKQGHIYLYTEYTRPHAFV